MTESLGCALPAAQPQLTHPAGCLVRRRVSGALGICQNQVYNGKDCLPRGRGFCRAAQPAASKPPLCPPGTGGTAREPAGSPSRCSPPLGAPLGTQGKVRAPLLPHTSIQSYVEDHAISKALGWGDTVVCTFLSFFPKPYFGQKSPLPHRHHQQQRSCQKDNKIRDHL